MSCPGGLFVISGPAGTGKGTLVHRIMKRLDDVWLSISATTRAPRPGEIEGVDYYFKSDSEFDTLIENDGLLEWAEVHGMRYGTPRDTVLQKIEEGKRVILEIDVQGAFQIRRRYPNAVLIFIVPPSMDELIRRLYSRGTETEEQIRRRLQTAKVELSETNEYDVQIVNDDLETATRELCTAIERFSGRS